MGMNIYSLIIISIFGIILGVVVIRFHRNHSCNACNPAYNSFHQHKDELKERIVVQIRRKGSVANDFVEVLLSVSDSTATRYLNELVEEGRIKRIAKGKYTHYILR